MCWKYSRAFTDPLFSNLIYASRCCPIQIPLTHPLIVCLHLRSANSPDERTVEEERERSGYLFFVSLLTMSSWMTSFFVRRATFCRRSFPFSYLGHWHPLLPPFAPSSLWVEMAWYTALSLSVSLPSFFQIAPSLNLPQINLIWMCYLFLTGTTNDTGTLKMANVLSRDFLLITQRRAPHGPLCLFSTVCFGAFCK